MKIKIMTSNAIEFVKRNIDKFVHYYVDGDDPVIWIKKELGSEAFVDVPDLEFEDFDLLIDENHPSSTDIYNIKLLYTKMKDLNDSFASDERLWAGLTHTIFYKYMRNRWGTDLDKNKIINNYFVKSTRFYVINGISRLWWYGRKTYSERFDNKFEMLDYMSKDLNGYGFTLFGSNWSNSERLLSLFFEALIELKIETGNKASRELFNDAMQYVNALCGIYLLDACEESFIKEKIKTYVINREKEIAIEKEQNKIRNVKTTGTERFDNVIKSVNYIGGHGTPKDIFNAFEIIAEKKVSLLDRNYITDSLKSKKYDGIFFKTQNGLFDGYRVSVSYLTKENRDKRKAFVNTSIDSLEGTDRLVFNLVNLIKKDKFIYQDIASYKQAIASKFPDIKNIDKMLENGLNKLVLVGILEKNSKSEFKKAYNFL